MDKFTDILFLPETNLFLYKNSIFSLNKLSFPKHFFSSKKKRLLLYIFKIIHVDTLIPISKDFFFLFSVQTKLKRMKFQLIFYLFIYILFLEQKQYRERYNSFLFILWKYQYAFSFFLKKTSIDFKKIYNISSAALKREKGKKNPKLV